VTRRTKLAAGIVAVMVLIAAAGVAIVFHGTLSVPAATMRSDGTPAGPIADARRVVQPLLSEYPGMAVAVVGDEGRVLWSEGFGSADVASRQPVDAETRFRIYSVSKPITAAVAARLAEQGALNLDAPVSAYLPELPPHLGQVTSRQLIGHLAGIRHYNDGEWLTVSSAACSTPIDGLGPVWTDSLTSVPGTEYSYTTFGYVLLSAVIEAAAGESFEDAVLHRVLNPVAMARTAIVRQDTTTGLSMFYEPAMFGRVRAARRIENSCKWGGGAYVASAVDLARFGHALAAGEIVGSDARAVVFRAMTDSSGKSTGYAFGWGVGTNADGRRYAASSGGAIGGRAAIYLYPDESLAVALVGNIEGENLTPTAAKIAEIFVAASGRTSLRN
jgi:serine beta-lactamase-like protein LACTB